MSEKFVLKPNHPASKAGMLALWPPSVPWARDITPSEVLPILLAFHRHNIEALRINEHSQNFCLKESRDCDLSQ